MRNMMQQQNLSEFVPEVKKVQKELIKTDNGKKINLLKIYNDIPSNIKDNAYLSIFRNGGRDVNNIALYPCKYIPELPRWAIKNYSKKNDILLDPFIGGGTTFVESLKLNRNCFGIDYNPYANLVSKVKSTIIDKNSLKSSFYKLKKSIYLDKDNDILKPTFRNVDFWFNPEVILGLSKIKKHINNIENKNIRNFFLVAFSMTVRKASYIAPGQVLTARRKDWRDMKHLSEKETFDLFVSFCKEYMVYLFDFYNKISKDNFCKIIGKDARRIVLPDLYDKVDLIVCSPPYINAMDYIWANRLRIHWLDLVESDKHRLNLYKYEIGTERISKKEYEKIGKTGFNELDGKIEKIYYSHNQAEQSMLRSRVTYKYFVDMEKHFKEAYRVLKNGGRYCIVVGDNNIRKVHIPTSKYLTDIAESVGFNKEKQFQIILKHRTLNVERNLDFADKIDFDRMIVLKK